MAYLETALALVFTSLGLCVFAYLWKINNSMKQYRFPPGPSGWPLIGNVLSLDMGKLHLSFSRLGELYGDIVCIQIFNQKAVILNSIEVINQVYMNDDVTATASSGRNKTFFGQYVYTDLQSIVFLSTCPQQMKMRRIFMRTLRMYGDGVQSKEALIQEELSEYVLRGLANQNGQEFNPDDVIYPSLINILCLLMLGKRLESNDPLIKTISDTCAALSSLISHDVDMVLATFPLMRHVTLFKPGRCFQEAMRTKHELVKFLVDDQIASYSPQLCRGMMDDLIHAMKQDEGAGSQWITHATLQGFAIDTFGAGTETTRCSLLSFLLALVNFPHVAIRIQSEIDEVIGDGRLPGLKDRENMPYLNAVILEMFRTAPVVPIPVPRRTTEDITFGSYSIPKGTMILTNVWNVHHNERIFPNPDEFLPERFLDSSGKLFPIEHKRRRSVVPFNLGRRSCPGDTFATARIFLYIATILQRFNLERGESCPPYEPENFTPTLMVRPDKFDIKAIPR